MSETPSSHDQQGFQGQQNDGKKRKKSTMRNRSKIACRECRRRKVRCDVGLQKDRCTNCRLDQIKCVVDCGMKRTSLTTTTKVNRPTLAVRSNEDSMYQSVHYARPPPPNVMADELQYLKAIGAFQAPKAPIIKELLKAYIQHVHSFFPVLDLRPFLEAILVDPESTPELRVSLLLFHSVLAAGLTYVDPQVFAQAGWSNRDVFRGEMLRKVKALYNMGYEESRLVLCQSSILMSIAQEDPEQPDESRRWLDLAWLSLESSVIANEDPEGAGDVSETAIWRRVWWACYVQDCRLAIAGRRPVSRPRWASDIPPITPKDFEIGCYSTMAIEAFPSLPVLRSTELQKEQIKMSMAHNELYTHIDSILAHGEVSFNRGPWSWYPRGSPRRHGLWQPQRPALTYEQCRDQLSTWVRTNASYVLRPHSFGETDSTWLCRCIELQIVSTSALSLLMCSRPSESESPVAGGRDTPISSSDGPGPDDRPQHVSRLLKTATDVTNAFVTLANHKLLYCFSPGVVQLLMPAAAIHFSQCVLQDGKGRAANLWRLRQCLGVFEVLGTTCPSAKTCSAFLEDALSRLTLTMTASKGSQARISAETSSSSSSSSPVPLCSESGSSRQSQATASETSTSRSSEPSQSSDEGMYTLPSLNGGGPGPDWTTADVDADAKGEGKGEGEGEVILNATDMDRLAALLATDHDVFTPNEGGFTPNEGNFTPNEGEGDSTYPCSLPDSEHPGNGDGESAEYSTTTTSPSSVDCDSLISMNDSVSYRSPDYITMPNLADDMDMDDSVMDCSGSITCIAPSQLQLLL